MFSRLLLITFLLAATFSSQAQDNWHLLSPDKDEVYGAGVLQAYKELQGKTATPVIVAVIDNGTDIKHKDLEPITWTNKNEVPGNGIDDDGNGYTDDVHGWNFLGGTNGDIGYEAMQETRDYFILKKQFANIDTTDMNDSLKEAYEKYLAKEKLYTRMQTFRVSSAKGAATGYKLYKKNLFIRMVLKAAIGKDAEKQLEMAKTYTAADTIYNKLDADSMRRAIVGDNPDDPHERYYGNSNVVGEGDGHGTHTAGIVASICRQAGNITVMPVRAVPEYGDERDKDVANSIRYAVDNGAKVISMSFGKHYSPDSSVVDSAIRYALAKDVLIVHGAGNDSRYMDSNFRRNHPNPRLDSVTCVPNWIEVGATGRKKNIVAKFSNYGYQAIDIFAPGEDIYSTLPGNEYGYESGTSMAAPVVAGVAALIRSYFPELSAAEVRTLLMETATQYKKYVKVPGQPKTLGTLDYMSRSGGIVNAERAVAAALKK